jgi:hypothetical protein
MATRRNVTYSKVQDKRLEAYKAWVSAFYFRLTGKTVDTRTDQQWEQSWREFWQNANKKDK